MTHKRNLLVVCLVVLIALLAMIPVTVSAGEGIYPTIKKANGEAAVKNEDYELDGGVIYLYTEGLILSGESTYPVEVADDVYSVTLDSYFVNLTANDVPAITLKGFGGTTVVTVASDSSVIAEGYAIRATNGNLVFDGNGKLTAEAKACTTGTPYVGDANVTAIDVPYGQLWQHGGTLCLTGYSHAFYAANGYKLGDAYGSNVYQATEGNLKIAIMAAGHEFMYGDTSVKTLKATAEKPTVKKADGTDAVLDEDYAYERGALVLYANDLVLSGNSTFTVENAEGVRAFTLAGIWITNADACINIRKPDALGKVTITLKDGTESTLYMRSSFRNDEKADATGIRYDTTDLCIAGEGVLNVNVEELGMNANAFYGRSAWEDRSLVIGKDATVGVYFGTRVNTYSSSVNAVAFGHEYIWDGQTFSFINLGTVRIAAVVSEASSTTYRDLGPFTLFENDGTYTVDSANGEQNRVLYISYPGASLVNNGTVSVDMEGCAKVEIFKTAENAYIENNGTFDVKFGILESFSSKILGSVTNNGEMSFSSPDGQTYSADHNLIPLWIEHGTLENNGELKITIGSTDTSKAVMGIKVIKADYDKEDPAIVNGENGVITVDLHDGVYWGYGIVTHSGDIVNKGKINVKYGDGGCQTCIGIITQVGSGTCLINYGDIDVTIGMMTPQASDNGYAAAIQVDGELINYSGNIVATVKGIASGEASECNALIVHRVNCDTSIDIKGGSVTLNGGRCAAGYSTFSTETSLEDFIVKVGKDATLTINGGVAEEGGAKSAVKAPCAYFIIDSSATVTCDGAFNVDGNNVVVDYLAGEGTTAATLNDLPLSDAARAFTVVLQNDVVLEGNLTPSENVLNFDIDLNGFDLDFGAYTVVPAADTATVAIYDNSANNTGSIRGTLDAEFYIKDGLFYLNAASIPDTNPEAVAPWNFVSETMFDRIRFGEDVTSIGCCLDDNVLLNVGYAEFDGTLPTVAENAFKGANFSVSLSMYATGWDEFPASLGNSSAFANSGNTYDPYESLREDGKDALDAYKEGASDASLALIDEWKDKIDDTNTVCTKVLVEQAIADAKKAIEDQAAKEEKIAEATKSFYDAAGENPSEALYRIIYEEIDALNAAESTDDASAKAKAALERIATRIALEKSIADGKAKFDEVAGENPSETVAQIVKEGKASLEYAVDENDVNVRYAAALAKLNSRISLEKVIAEAYSALDAEAEGATTEVKNLILDGKKEIDRATDEAGVKAAKDAALLEIRARKSTEKLAKSKRDAKAEIELALGRNPSDEKKKIASDAYKTIESAPDEASVEAAKNAALKKLGVGQKIETGASFWVLLILTVCYAPFLIYWYMKHELRRDPLFGKINTLLFAQIVTAVYAVPVIVMTVFAGSSAAIGLAIVSVVTAAAGVLYFGLGGLLTKGR